MKQPLCIALLSTAFGMVVAPASAQMLLAHYELNEAAGATICADSSGNGNVGTYRLVPALGLPGSSVGCGTSAEFDDAAGSDVSIISNGSFDSLTSNISVSAWVNPDALPPANGVARIFGNNNGGWTCGLRGDGLIFTTRFVKDYLFPAVPITPQAWNHVVFVFDANFAVTVYVDGVPMGTETGISPANFPNEEWFIGGFDGTIEFFDGLIDDVQIYEGSLTASQVMELSQNSCATVGITPPVGTNYCGPAVPNSTGISAMMEASGSRLVAGNDLTLMVSGMPSFSFGFFITSQTQAFVPQPGGSQGVLCVGGSVGRYVGPGQVQQSASAGTIELQLDLTMMPQPLGFVSAAAGDTWNFQAWYRDGVGGVPTSNFTDGFSVTFQ